MPDARELFAHVPTMAIADVLVLLGLALIMEDIQPLEPLTTTHVAAPVTTLQFAPAQDPTTPCVNLYDVLEDIPPGTCVVAAGGLPLAVLGANGARVAARRGAVSAVVDGAVRDVRALNALGLPVWHRSVRPLAYTPRPGPRHRPHAPRRRPHRSPQRCGHHAPVSCPPPYHLRCRAGRQRPGAAAGRGVVGASRHALPRCTPSMQAPRPCSALLAA